jgi:hypothetical protein
LNGSSARLSLAAAVNDVLTVRTRNEDVFIWPSIEWDIIYCHEELDELARVIQPLKEPDHARNSTDKNLTPMQRLHMEWGQEFMMLATLAIQIRREFGAFDPDQALAMALAKLSATSTRKRAALSANQE